MLFTHTVVPFGLTHNLNFRIAFLQNSDFYQLPAMHTLKGKISPKKGIIYMAARVGSSGPYK